jgi:phage antirepressor YoqD-like protein
MSSREIAQLCQKRHDNVCNDIRILNETYEKMGLLKIKDTLYTNEQNGQQYREYLLTKEQSIDLVTGYNRELRIAINRRWQELESSQSLALPNFTDPASAAEAWAKEYREKQALAIENQALKPKADAYEILSGAKGSVSIRVASGELKVPEKKFVQWLLDNDWAYREGNRTDGKLLPHAHRKEQGYLELVSVVTYNTGEAVARSQTKVTQKGLARLAQIFSKNRALLTHKIGGSQVIRPNQSLS